MHKNIKIFQQIVPQITKYNSEGILLVVTNPVDILTYATLQISGLPRARVIGSGTVLDTARLKYLLGRWLGVDPGVCMLSSSESMATASWPSGRAPIFPAWT